MKTIIRGIIVSAILLSACDDETFTDVEKSVESNNSGVVLKSRIAFDQVMAFYLCRMTCYFLAPLMVP